MTAIPATEQTDVSFMDREGKRWILDDIEPFFLPGFYKARRREDGKMIVVHRSDFFRTQKG